jgi:hypothetical protein
MSTRQASSWTLAAGAIVMVAALVSGCGPAGKAGAAASGSPGPSGSGDVRAAALAFSSCMREHNYQVPDPTFNDQGWPQFDEGNLRGDPHYEAVRAQCRTALDAAAVAAGAPTKQETQDQLLAFARCMRDQGVNMPDPVDGGLRLDSQLLDSPPWHPAAQACKEHLPGKYQELANLNVTGGGKGGGGK